MKSQFEIIYSDRLMIVLIDKGQGKSITNDACNVIPRLAELFPIRGRRVYYRDTSGRFDQLKVCHDKYFMGFAPCSPGQQIFFRQLVKGITAAKAA